ncbi:MAG: HD domain-containing protein [Rhodospirillaceae bacterium]
MNAIVAFSRAVDFAARKHADQRRKGATAEPYINHPIEVARMLAEATDGNDLDLVIAGLLHDILEDTATGRPELEALFGRVVAELVAEVSDDKSLPQAQRKQLQILHTPQKSVRAKLIKIADKTSNIRGIVTGPPVDWTLERKHDYFTWSLAVIVGCRGINSRLESLFDEAYHSGLAQLGQHSPGA